MTYQRNEPKTYTGSSSNGVWQNDAAVQQQELATELRATFNGRVIAPGDAGYDEARTVFVGGIDRRPAAIIRPADADEVARAVKLARESGLELAVRSGGHSPAGHSVSEGGIVLDLHNLRRLDIDVEQRTAWAGAGLTSGEYTKAAGEYGLATGFGDTGSVGIGGLTLGGGVGFLARKYGLTIDNLLAAEIVTASGQILHVDAESYPDLFWAIRGGGGNFGVVTRFQFRLHPVPQIVGGSLILPATPEVIAGVAAEADAAPEELTTIVNVMSAPPLPFLPAEYHGRLVVWAHLCYAGGAAAGEQAIAPFRALAEPIADLVRPMRYPELFPPEQGDFHPTGVVHPMFVEKVGLREAETIIEHLEAPDGPMRAMAQLRVLGGAVARVPAEATAYAHRAERVMVNFAAIYGRPEERPAAERWLANFAAALDQGRPGAYVNFLGEDGAERLSEAYPPATLARLIAVKRRYDPTNLFRLNQNISPAS